MFVNFLDDPGGRVFLLRSEQLCSDADMLFGNIESRKKGARKGTRDDLEDVRQFWHLTIPTFQHHRVFVLIFGNRSVLLLTEHLRLRESLVCEPVFSHLVSVWSER